MRAKRRLTRTGRTGLILLFCLAATGAAGCGSDDGEANGGMVEPSGLQTCTVRLEGHYYLGYALKGTSEKAGLVKKAVLLALTEINDAGGIDGKSIGLVECDTQGDETVAHDVMVELGGIEPLPAIVGTGMSGTVLSSFEAAAAAKKVLISPAATSPDITELEDDGFVFRTAVSDDFQGNVLARICLREELRRVYVIAVDNSWGNALSKVFVGEFTRLWNDAGGDPAELQAVTFDAATLDVGALVQEAQAWAPDGVLLIALADNGAAIIKTAANEGWNPQWLLTDGVKTPNLLDKVGAPEALEGALGTSPAPPLGERYEAFEAAFKAAWNEDPFTFAATGYDATWLLAMAMACCVDPSDGTEVRDNLAKTTGGDTAIGPNGWADFLAALDAGDSVDFRGASGEVDLDANGDVQGNVEEWAVRSGEIVSEGCWTPAGEACPE